MLIYATMFCTILMGHAPACRLTAPPMIFETQAECRQSLERLFHQPMVDGRIVLSATDNGTNWWQCASKKIEEWKGS